MVSLNSRFCSGNSRTLLDPSGELPLKCARSWPKKAGERNAGKKQETRFEPEKDGMKPKDDWSPSLGGSRNNSGQQAQKTFVGFSGWRPNLTLAHCERRRFANCEN